VRDQVKRFAVTRWRANSIVINCAAIVVKSDTSEDLSETRNCHGLLGLLLDILIVFDAARNTTASALRGTLAL